MRSRLYFVLFGLGSMQGDFDADVVLIIKVNFGARRKYPYGIHHVVPLEVDRPVANFAIYSSSTW
jgi:hypothetical protein